MTNNKIKKILIANRGEIAVRIIKTCKILNIKTVAIYSDLDKDSLFVQNADEKYSLNGITAKETYLDIDKIIDIAIKSNSDAVHPGYGFLSENAEFAARVTESNIKFIGPSAQSILAMGLKSEAKRLMQTAGVSILTGYHDDDNSFEKLKREADKIGYPILIKAAAGGGGKGMRIVRASCELEQSIESTKREALKNFANDKLILEKFIEKPRHIEIQVLCDNHGNGVYLFERDCTLQRRYQKIIEEAPAPDISESLRAELGKQALLAAKSINYTGAGTVEFLLDNDKFYFMEMNTRLQVEHPVTELITNIDLVEQQILIADNQQLSIRQEDLKITGHAIEARIYAEDVDNNFLPSTGKISYLEYPKNIRVDSGIQAGDNISIYYDPMLSKIISYGSKRKEAISNLKQALSSTYLLGIKNNIEFLVDCLDNQDFIDNKIYTNYLDKTLNENEKNISHDIDNIIWAAAGLYFNYFSKSLVKNNPWSKYSNFRLNQENLTTITLTYSRNSQSRKVLINNINNHSLESLESLSSEVYLDDLQGDKYICSNIKYANQILEFNSTKIKAICVKEGDINNLYLFYNGRCYKFNTKVKRDDNNHSHHKGVLNAPMHGTIVDIKVNQGSEVEIGDALVILEAMKMEHVITAPKKGIITTINFKQGEQVAEGAELLVME